MLLVSIWGDLWTGLMLQPQDKIHPAQHVRTDNPLFDKVCVSRCVFFFIMNINIIIIIIIIIIMIVSFPFSSWCLFSPSFAFDIIMLSALVFLPRL